jgi:hypothetical protein
MFYNDIQCLRIFIRSLYMQNINTVQQRRNIDIQVNNTFTLAFHRVLINTSSRTTIQSYTICRRHAQYGSLLRSPHSKRSILQSLHLAQSVLAM